MSHIAQKKFIDLVAKHMPEYFQGSRVLEVGSLNINGSVREFFRDCEYLGIDVAPGRDVDVVCQGQEFNGPDDHFDQVISCEAMEHNPHWRETFENMVRVCRPRGLVLMTCATVGRPEHGTARTSRSLSPLTVSLGWDYYKNLARQDFVGLPTFNSKFSRFRFWTNWRSFDLYFCGLKKSDDTGGELEERWRRMQTAVNAYTAQENAAMLCRYRSIVSKLGGDTVFSSVRRFAKLVQYVHGG